MEKTYSTFLFDFDGTLIDSNEHVIQSFKKAFQEVLHEDIAQETITATFGIPLEEAIYSINPHRAPELLKAYRKYAEAFGDSLLLPIDGAREVLEALRQLGCTIAIVTSKKEVNALRQMRLFGLEKHYDFLIGPEKTTRHKPDPAPVLLALEMSQSTANQALMIGDSPHDILCGKNASVDTAGVSFTAVGAEALKKAEPTYMINHLSELLAWAKPSKKA